MGSGSNCIASSVIGCLFCWRGCNAEKLRNAFTFLPQDRSYDVTSLQADGPEGKSPGSRMAYVKEVLKNSQCYRNASLNAVVHEVKTKTGNTIPIVWVRVQAHKTDNGDGDNSSRLVLLHCHGNATDIGLMMVVYAEMSRLLGIDVVGVEYSGYGTADGKPSIANTFADTESALDFVIAQGVPPSRIVAYGQSVGSGPASNLAVSRGLGGLVLHSAMLSGIRVLDPDPDKCCRPSCVWGCFDFYPNHSLLKRLRCPTLIMHGRKDDIIPFYHGYRLFNLIPPEFRWPGYFPLRASHNDIVETDPRGYFGELSNFLRDVARFADGEAVLPPRTRGALPSSDMSSEGRLRNDQRAQPKAYSSVKRPELSCGLLGIGDTSAGDCRSVQLREYAAVNPTSNQVPRGEPEAVNGEEDDYTSEEHSLYESVGGSSLSGIVAEPAAGPDDGRYSRFRQAELWPVSPK